jgi:hypothetical protein
MTDFGADEPVPPVGQAFALADQLACDASLNAEELYKANSY